MNQFLAVAKNTCLQTMRQPVYGLIVLVTLGGIALLPSLTGWTLDDDNKMLRDLGLSTLLMQGLLLAAFSASSSLDVEIEDKTVLSVVAKPVTRVRFLLGKFVGLVGAVLAAHYLATIAYLMAMRHGVMQAASDTSDTVVLTMGLGLMGVVAVWSVAANYFYERRFLPTFVTFALPAMTFSGAVLLVVDKNWEFSGYVTRQPLDRLPEDVAQRGDFRGLIEFRPAPGNAFVAGHTGHLVRSNFKGPISDEDQQYLLSLSTDQHWKKQVNFLVQECRKVQGPELVKASVLIFGALLVLSALALAVSTRFGMMATFLASLVALSLGLAADQIVKPYATEHPWAAYVYPLIPNFQFFWMIDALTDDRVIPLSFMVSALGYSVVCSAAFLALAATMFETREVG